VSKQFWIFFGIAAVVVAVVVGIVWEGNKGAHLELDGRILHVRTLALNPNATIVIVDFRETNPSDVLFIVRDVTMKLEGAPGDPVGQLVARADMDALFNYNKLIGPRFNDTLSPGDRIAPHSTFDRMVGARFELSEAAVEARRAVHLEFDDVDRAVAELTETKEH
jgi:hypothetical protein